MAPARPATGAWLSAPLLLLLAIIAPPPPAQPFAPSRDRRRLAPSAAAFVYPGASSRSPAEASIALRLAEGPYERGDGDAKSDDEGKSLASDFFKALQERNIQIEADEFLGEEEDEEEDEDDEEEINFPAGAVNAALGFDPDPGVGENLAGNVTLTNKQVYDELKERVLESAGGFVDLLGGASEDEEDEDEKPKVYMTPEKVPDPELTAGEVVQTVLSALKNNNLPASNRGIEVLFGYSSPGSAVMSAVKDEGMTAEEYAEFLEDSEYKVLFEHEDVVIDKGEYSFDRKKAFYTARLRIGPGALDLVSVNFILSTQGNEEDDCWLVDSMLIRPEKMRRRRRK